MNFALRNFLSPLIAALLLAASPLSFAQSPVPAAPSVGATSYVLVDYHSDTVVAELDADSQVEPASITKLMTSYVVFSEVADGNMSLSDEVLISEKAWRTEGSRMFIEVGERVTVEELLKGVIIQSGNDASVALAEYVGGTEEVFAEMMNEAARNLGMSNTHFVNATGLPHPEHYTTARDIARLADALIEQFPDFYGWYSEREYTFNGIRQHNRNRLLWRDPSVDGLKTGHTESAGYCLVTSAMRDGMRLISVVMGTDSEDARATASQALLNYGFRFFETYQLYESGDEISVEPIWKGAADEVTLGVDSDLFVTIPRGRYDALEARLEVDDTLTAPIASGKNVGRLVVSLDDADLADRPLVALEGVEQAGFFGRSIDGFRLWVGGLFGGD
ncbi:MAG: D-alanyl-D-alanine carboxypeptidase family protein [Wenzhouxiangella sp.]|jgi:D-alanyl-D-alanine carboxypeptidase (penicillin-binding protein 5/6)|nr:D-alanyl-D-alanine carboxypeptidase family protein [Wenzhouxiangella sp.]